MAKQQIRKTVFDKSDFDKVIDRKFSTYAQPEDPDDPMTVSEFFEEYERLFFDIPPGTNTSGTNTSGTTGEGGLGSTEELIPGTDAYIDAFNSHAYIIKRSSELVDFDKDTEDIQPLLDEIAQLRNQNLEQANEIIDLQTQIAARGGE